MSIANPSKENTVYGDNEENIFQLKTDKRFMKNRIRITVLLLLVINYNAKSQDKPVKLYHEPFRPQIHFSPKEKWTNDPNGMVYYKGLYHLFFQHYPNDIVWGPMHWGHAVSKDLIHWTQLPIALYPDKLGYIFSGSAVVDYQNTSGFGKKGQVPMVAIFTNHDPKGEKAGTNNYQNESLAYSLDEGKNWTKYADNPVLKNPGIKDFRDPKVMWYAPQKKWLMALATKDRITFFSSPNLKSWHKESEFGKTLGAHGGVWECPDLFPLQLNQKTYWVLLVSINPGGPNKGSATQYFIGNFDGKTFTPLNTAIKWIDYGPDDYAGITWSNTGERKIFLGWMSNWLYGNMLPTKRWRNAMTIPRELSLKQANGGIFLASNPVKELIGIEEKASVFKNISVEKETDLSKKLGKLSEQYLMKLTVNPVNDYTIMLSNDGGDELIIGFDSKKKTYYIDRSKSGQVSFEKDFPGKFTSPRLTSASSADLTIVADDSSVELFADGGLTVMSSLFFPKAPFSHIKIGSASHLTVQNLTVTPLKSIW